MPLASRSSDESLPLGGFSPPAGRPLFIPPGISVVRTGPTTRAELDRLLSDVHSTEASGVRLSPLAASAPRWSSRLAAAL
ncbi:MAG TPA: hypothetical protein VHW01_29415, partial [Polyangiaceae bacterium]|nr:hypothetical protein [Polyangiaceae bacterium]